MLGMKGERRKVDHAKEVSFRLVGESRMGRARGDEEGESGEKVGGGVTRRR